MLGSWPNASVRGVARCLVVAADQYVTGDDVQRCFHGAELHEALCPDYYRSDPVEPFCTARVVSPVGQHLGVRLGQAGCGRSFCSRGGLTGAVGGVAAGNCCHRDCSSSGDQRYALAHRRLSHDDVPSGTFGHDFMAPNRT